MTFGFEDNDQMEPSWSSGSGDEWKNKTEEDSTDDDRFKDVEFPGYLVTNPPNRDDWPLKAVVVNDDIGMIPKGFEFKWVRELTSKHYACYVAELNLDNTKVSKYSGENKIRVLVIPSQIVEVSHWLND